jgi:hypothetical protein
MNNLVAKYAQRLPCGTGYHKDDKHGSINQRVRMTHILCEELMDTFDGDDINWLDFLNKDDTNNIVFSFHSNTVNSMANSPISKV